MVTAFTPSRRDGRSDRLVIYELVSGAEPGSEFDYSQLRNALAIGIDRPVSMPRVYRAVRDANRTLLRQDRRSLGVVKGYGYRVLRADEHLPVAIGRKSRAEVQMRRGLEVLRDVRWDEMLPTQRKAHEGQLLVMDGLCRAIEQSERRHARHEAAIDEIRRRVDQLEDKSTDDNAGQG